MQKKYIAFPFIAACALRVGCSEDPATAVNSPDIPAIPYLDPETGDTIPVPVTALSSETVPGSSASMPGFSSSGFNFPGSSTFMPGSSAVNPKSSSSKAKSSSSVGLKEYDDNHLPKDSYLPPAGFYSN